MLMTITKALMPSPITHIAGHFAFLHDKGVLMPFKVCLLLATSAIYDQIKLVASTRFSLWIVDNLCFVVVRAEGHLACLCLLAATVTSGSPAIALVVSWCIQGQRDH